jgi:aryl sulfotransferase
MAEAAIGWPKKTRELQTAIFDSTRWNGFRLRDDDIVIVTWAKSGTTWTQQIVGQLILGAPDGLEAVESETPWLDFRVIPYEPLMAGLEAQRHRRFIKTHLPVDALGIDPRAKYIYVGRDARDVVWSAYNHQAGFTESLIGAFNNLPGRVGPPVTYPPGDVRDSYLYFLDHGQLPGFPILQLWSHVQGWWNTRQLPNVLLVHYGNLKADMGGEIRRIARFLGITIDEAKWPAILEHCSFDYMRKAAGAIEGLKEGFKDGGNTFFHKGTNGRWKDVLSAEEIRKCDDVAAQNLSSDYAHWLKTGDLPE